MQDKEIIEKILEGQQDLYSYIVDKYKNKVFSIIYSFCGQTGDSEDIAQNVFIKIFKALPKFKFESEFSTWMYRIVINESITISKKNKQYIIPLNVNSDNADESKNNLINLLKSKDNIEKQLIQQETQQIVQTAIKQLNDKYKTVLTLRDIEDFSYEEIAQIMNVSTGNIKILIFRARNRLKEILIKGDNL